MTKKILLIAAAAAFLSFQPSCSEAGLRGMPEGKPKIEVGAHAPLDMAELRKAHKEGKAILLMFGNPDHCIYCEKVWRSVGEIQEENLKDVAGVMAVHRASKFWGPETEAAALGQTYGVVGEPWLFLIDKEGIIRRIYMGFVEKSEIEKGLKQALTSDDKGR